MARIALILGSLVISILLAEIALRAFVAIPQSHYIWTPGMDIEFRPEPGLMPGIEGVSKFTINSQGLRGDDHSGDGRTTILCLGGSTTECLYLDDAETWPQLLQEQLNSRSGAERYRVLNGGRSGLNMQHHVLQMERVLPEMPEIDTVVLLVGINDLLRNLDKGIPPDTPGPDVLAESFLVPPVEEPPFGSRIIHLWNKANEPRREVPEALIQDRVGKVYETWRGYRRTAELQGRMLPPTDYTEKLRLREIERVAELAREHGVRVLFLSQPVLWREGLSPKLKSLLWMGGTGTYQVRSGSSYYEQADLAAMMDAVNADTAAQCAALGVPFYDLARDMRSDTAVFYDDCHFNEHGAREVARLVAEYWLAHVPTEDD